MAASNTDFFPLPIVRVHQWIKVKLDSGEIVERDPGQLLELPPHLAVPLEELAPPGN